MLAMMFIDKNKFNTLENSQRIKLISCPIGVRTANLIGTKSIDKRTNLSIISAVVHFVASPAIFSFVIRPDSVPRDSLNNLRESPYLTINCVNTNITENAHQISARYKAEESVFNKCKFTEDNGTHMIVCEVLAIHLAEECLGEDFSIDITKANSVGVSGPDQYLSLESLGRASYAR
jgi:flavin reductase (DIM6/NTAB) family NADH-FMN oxidoreductase RutF